MHTPRKANLLLVLAALTAAMLACNLPGSGNRRSENTPIPVSTESVMALETQVAQAAATASAGGAITLELTEQQLTSTAAMQLQSQGETGLRDLQVRLRDGQMQLSGVTNQGGLDLPVTMSLRLDVDPNGVPRTTVTNASVGPFDLPANLVSEIQTRVDQMVMAQLGATSNEIAVDSITIADGKMTIVAHRR
ncbi:MAG: hypothetical protein ACKOC5_05615 [Chloroflexota bacterium]